MLKNIKLKNKIIIYFFLLVIPIISLFTISALMFFYDHFEEGFLASQERIMDTEKTKINMFLDGFEEETLFLSKLNGVNIFVNSEDEEERENIKNKIEEVFLDFLKVKEGKYYEIRYIDEKGDELIKVYCDQSDCENKNYQIIKQDLENKKDEKYFTETMKLENGEIYISYLDLKKQGDNVVIPYIPTIRYATPVFDKNNNKKGIIITNIFASDFLDNIRKLQNGKMVLVNKDGYYLYYEDNEEKEWSFMFDNKKDNIINDFPLFIEILENKEDGQIFDKNTDLYFTYKFIYPFSKLENKTEDKNDSDYFWLITRLADRNIVLRDFYNFSVYIIILFIIVILLLFFAVSIYSRKFMKPVEELTEKTKKVSEGNFDLKMNLEGDNEFVDLANSFNKMTDELKDYKNNFEKKVNERTEKIEKLNKFMVGRELKIVELKEKLNKKNSSKTDSSRSDKKSKK